MKIAFVVHNISKRKGHDRYTAELIEHYCNNHQVFVFASNLTAIDRRKVRFYKIPTIQWPVLFKILSFFLFASFIIGIVDKKRHFDIVHYQGATGMPTGTAVITAHVCGASYLRMYKEIMAEQEGFICGLYHTVYLFTVKILEKMIYSRQCVRKIIAPSVKTKNELMKFYRIDKERIEVIYEGAASPQGIDADTKRQKLEAARKEIGIKGDRPVILFVGDFLTKGLLYLIKAVNDIDCFLLVIGRGDKRYFSKFVKFKNRVLFMKEGVNIENYYLSSDIFAFPSLYDAFALVVLEALSHGIPSVVSKKAGVTEILEDGKDAILLDNPLDIEEIKTSIERLLTDAQLRMKLTENSIKKARIFSWEKVASETMKLYKEVVLKRGQDS